jgi:HEAT repeat protein
VIAFRSLAVVAAVLAAAACDLREPRYEYKTEREWVGILTDGKTNERVWAAGALEGMKAKSDAARSALLAASRDTTTAVSVAAIHALGVLRDSRVSRELVLSRVWRVASDSLAQSRVRALEALGLEHYADDRSVPILVAALRDRAADVRATAALSLGQLGSRARAALPALHTALGDTNDLVRVETRHAITAISGEKLPH